MFRLFGKSKPAFGLDISGGSFKTMLIENQGQRTRVKSLSHVLLPKGLLINDAITDVKTFVYLLRQSLEKPQLGRLDSNYVIASLPESKSFVRVIQIPLMSDAEAESAIPFEAESFIPLPIEQVYLDWQKLGTVGDKMNILIIASPKEFVDKYLDILDQAELRPVALEVESQSCHRALIEKNSTETVLIVDAQTFRSNLIMVEEGKLQFTSSVPIAGNAFTESIARILGVSSSKAEEIKKKVGIANTPEYPNIKVALLPTLNNFCAEIRGILKFHHEHSEKMVSKILLSGGSSRLKYLPEFLVSQFAEFEGLKVELGNPWQNLPNLKNPPMESHQALNYVTVIGLAIKGLIGNRE